MRKVISLKICFTLIINISFAQLPAPGFNILRPDLNKFEGTWKWVSANSELSIQLKKLNYHFSDENYNEDIIVGSHKYIENGVLVGNYLPDFPLLGQDHAGTIFIYQDAVGLFPNKISGGLTDHRKHKKVNLTLEYVAGSPVTLIWHSQVRGGFITDPSIEGLTLPADLILIKQ